MTLILLATLFLPLFPFSMLLNWLLTRLHHPFARCMLLLLWPQIGVLLVSLSGQTVPPEFAIWAVASSAIYALRLLTVRDLGMWTGYIASSALALTWGLAAQDKLLEMQIFVFWFSLPAALLALLTWPLAKRFGAAFAGLYGGLAGSVPRLSGLLVFTLLAAIATPPSPGFFAMLGLLSKLGWPLAPGVLLIWLLWGWAATKLMQGFVFGEERAAPVADIGSVVTVLYSSALGVFVVTGFFLTGGIL